MNNWPKKTVIIVISAIVAAVIIFVISLSQLQGENEQGKLNIFNFKKTIAPTNKLENDGIIPSIPTTHFPDY